MRLRPWTALNSRVLSFSMGEAVRVMAGVVPGSLRPVPEPGESQHPAHRRPLGGQAGGSAGETFMVRAAGPLSTKNSGKFRAAAAGAVKLGRLAKVFGTPCSVPGRRRLPEADRAVPASRADPAV